MNKAFKFLAVQLTMEACRSNFNGMIQMVKDYDKAVEEVIGTTEVNAMGKTSRREKKCKYKGCGRPFLHTTKDCRYKKAADKSRQSQQS